MDSHSGDLAKLSLMLFVCYIPALAAFTLALMRPDLLLPLAAAAAAAALPVGGANTAACFCVSKMLRDDPGYVGHDFWRKLRENFGSAAAFGVFATVVSMAQVYALLLFLAGNPADSIPATALWLLSALLLGMASPYFYLQTAYINLGPLSVLKNSLLLMLLRLPRSFAGVIFANLVFFATALFWPYSAFLLILLPFLGCTLSLLPALMWVWPVVDAQFSIEEALKKRESGEGEEQQNNQE